MTTHCIVPTFNKSTPNKVHNNLIVKDENAVSNAGGGWNSAIATQSIPATVDGEYIFAVRIDTIRDASIMIGVIPLETFDSNKDSYPGSNAMSGSAIYLRNGNYYPGVDNLIGAYITENAKEVIVVVTIANNGARKLIQFIVDGTPSSNRDCTTECKGDKLFPVVTLYYQDQQITTIPIDQITIRNDEVNKLIEKFSKQSSANQGAAAFAQLQQELEKERKRADLAETQVRQKDQEVQNEKKLSAALTTQVQQKDQQLQQATSEITQLKHQLLTLQSQLNSSNNSPAPSSPFAKDKLYQIDFAANGIAAPEDPNAFGTLLKLPSQNNSVLFQHVKNDLWKKLGTMIPTPKGVYDFTLESIEVIYSDVATLEARMRRLQQLRSQNGSFFNPPTGAFTAEQLQTLIALRDQFLPRSSTADPKSPNLINVFHGTKVDRLQSVVNGLVAVRSTDAGYFGSGVYTTTSIEYAAKYAKGEFDFKFGPYPPRASDGCIPVVWCVAAVGVCYPLTREVDYSRKRVHDGMGVSDFFGTPLTPGYDCHCVAVNESVGFQAVPRDKMQYMEIVFDQEFQVLPIAVLWVKPM